MEQATLQRKNHPVTILQPPQMEEVILHRMYDVLCWCDIFDKLCMY